MWQKNFSTVVTQLSWVSKYGLHQSIMSNTGVALCASRHEKGKTNQQFLPMFPLLLLHTYDKQRTTLLTYFVTSCTIPERGSRQNSTFVLDVGNTRLLSKGSTTSTERAFEQVRLLLWAPLQRTKVSNEWGFWRLSEKKEAKSLHMHTYMSFSKSVIIRSALFNKGITKNSSQSYFLDMICIWEKIRLT